MHYIVGLGNPEDTYTNTRHNAGRIVLSTCIAALGLPQLVHSSKYNALISEGVVAREEVMVLFPETYMNKSGSSVQKVIQKQKEAERLIVVYDDIDLPLGSVRIAYGRGAGGHRGVASIIDALNTKNFIRIRIGIAQKSFLGNIKKPREEGAVAKFVLGDFKKRELDILDDMSVTVVEALKTIVTEGHVVAMNRFNQS